MKKYNRVTKIAIDRFGDVWIYEGYEWTLACNPFVGHPKNDDDLIKQHGPVDFYYPEGKDEL